MQERISDVSDRASQEEANLTHDAIQAARRQEPAPKDWDKESCYTCGDDLPEVRKAAMRFRCVPCQTKHEMKRKGY